MTIREWSVFGCVMAYPLALITYITWVEFRDWWRTRK